VERKHQHILGVARSLLFQANLPKTFWAHAIGHAVHIINRLPTPFFYLKSVLFKLSMTVYLISVPLRCLDPYALLLLFRLIDIN